MIAGLFPGQGVPAGVVAAALAEGREEVERAAHVLGLDLTGRVGVAARRGGSPLPTRLAQPAIFVASVVSWRRAVAEGHVVDVVAGHSLGEYSALVAAGSMSFEDALRVVSARGEAMHQASKSAPGGMVALLGLDLDRAQDVARRCGCVVANDNAPGQVVLSGPEDALTEAAAAARAEGGRAVLLEVSGAFHSGAVAEARDVLREGLDAVDIRTPEVPVVSNVTARPYGAPDEIRRLLVDQVVERVRFRESLEWMWNEGVRSFHDFGPGNTVAGLASRTFRELEREREAASA